MEKIKSILITGATGFLAWNLMHDLRALDYSVIGTVRTEPAGSMSAFPLKRLDLEQPSSIRDLALDDIDCIVHAAAIADKTVCSEQHQKAWRVNVAGTGELAERAARAGILFIFISTDLVFDGCRGWYSEDDPVSPASYYGETKAFAEEAVKSTAEKYYILRTALTYGANGAGYGSFLRWTMEALNNGKSLELFTNQYRNPLYAGDVSDAIGKLIQHNAPAGLYHLGGPERYSRFEIGCIAADALSSTRSGIHPSQLRRPGDCDIDDTTLLTTKIRTQTGMRFTPLPDGLRKTQQTALRQHVS